MSSPEIPRVPETAVPNDLPEGIRITYNPARPSATPGTQPRSRAGGLRLTRESATPPPSEMRGALDFVLRRVIARGGFGEVWEGEQKSLRRRIAIKRVRPDRIHDPAQCDEDADTLRQAFRYEVLTAAHLEHPNILPVYGLAIDDAGEALLGMKLVKGRPWDELIAADWWMEPRDLLDRHLPILISMTQAVAFAHSQWIVHRDLKPSQVMVGEFGEVLLMDWGLAVSLRGPQDEIDATGYPMEPNAPGLEYATNPSGTVAFMAPEQTEQTARHISILTDVYLLGGTLYYLLTGRVPHEAPESRTAFLMATEGRVTPPEQAAPGRDIPGELAQLAMKAMEPRAQDRVQSALEFLEAVRDYQTGASRRRESIALTGEVREGMEGVHGYRALSEMLNRVAKARELWPANPEAESLRRGLSARLADTALHNGDLVLARMQVEAIAGHEGSSDLLSRVAAAEEREERHRVQRRALMVGTTILVGLLFFVGASFILYQYNSRASLEKERDLAQAARSDADALMAYMLDDLLARLEQIGRVDLLDGASQKAIDYFERLNISQLPPEQRVRLAVALRGVAAVRREQGRHAEAIAELRHASAILEAVTAAHPRFREAREELAQNLLALGRVLAETGENVGARSCFSEILRSEAMSAAESGAHALATEGLARIKQGEGDLPGAVAGHRAALGLLSRALDGSTTNTALLGTEALVRRSLGVALAAGGDKGEGFQEVQASRLAFSDLVSRDPRDVRWQVELAETYSALGEMHAASGETTSALEMFSLALDRSQRLVDRDPGNEVWAEMRSRQRARVAALRSAP